QKSNKIVPLSNHLSLNGYICRSTERSMSYVRKFSLGRDRLASDSLAAWMACCPCRRRPHSSAARHSCHCSALQPLCGKSRTRLGQDPELVVVEDLCSFDGSDARISYRRRTSTILFYLEEAFMQKEAPSIYAAIDIGSNTIHLVVARCTQDNLDILEE